MMRVAIVYPIEFNEEGHIGGGERYALELARSLATQVDTRLITFGKVRRSYMIGPLSVDVFPRYFLIKGRLNNPGNPFFVRSLWDVDVIHCIGWNTMPTDLSVLFGGATRKRVYVTDVGGGADLTLRKYLPLDGLVHQFLFLSGFAASLYPEFKSRARVIYGGADLDRFSPGPTSRERKVLYVGRIIPAKGIEYLIDGTPPDVSLMVVGRPYASGYYSELLRRAAGRNVRFVIDADDNRVQEEYRSSLVTVLPAVKRSAYGCADAPNLLGLVLLESMACGTPVVCTDVGPEHEIVEDGVTGFVVPPNDASALRDRLSRLLAEPGLAERMGVAARARVLDMFTWGKTAQRCLEAYAG